MANIVIVDEKRGLTNGQVRCLMETQRTYVVKEVDSINLSIEEQTNLIPELVGNNTIIFATMLPFLIKELSFFEGSFMNGREQEIMVVKLLVNVTVIEKNEGLRAKPFEDKWELF